MRNIHLSILTEMYTIIREYNISNNINEVYDNFVLYPYAILLDELIDLIIRELHYE